MAKRGHSEEEILRVLAGGGVGDDGGGSLPQAWHQPAEFLSVEEEVFRTRSERTARARQLREENGKLKRLVADLIAGPAHLQEIVAKKL